MKRIKKVMAVSAGMLIVSGLAGGATVGLAHASDDTKDRSGWGHWDGQHAEATLALKAGLREHVLLGNLMFKAELAQPSSSQNLQVYAEANNALVVDQLMADSPQHKEWFMTLWRQHMVHYMEYLNAAKVGDVAAKQAAKEKLGTVADQMAETLVMSDPQLNKEVVAQHFRAHGEKVTNVIDKLVAGDNMGLYKALNETYAQVGDLARTIH